MLLNQGDWRVTQKREESKKEGELVRPRRGDPREKKEIPVMCNLDMSRVMK